MDFRTLRAARVVLASAGEEVLGYWSGSLATMPGDREKPQVLDQDVAAPLVNEPGAKQSVLRIRISRGAALARRYREIAVFHVWFQRRQKDPGRGW
ncbi:hypothetical protein SFA35_02035 [Pseudomonas sp. HR96]|uniref:hypothetical protein n=1 Tax=Pseudomonas sp. HR96 TaxID=1027966 RepID=UPI002A75F016|nr:hypothetical protein [Pseudomonas sp. HR96]WPP00193.1 hypothetical protein SFA35_02035 [Pseudomonas sp. HR96]